MNVRVRFAPSPTGFLHIGGARTALFNWLYARHTGGKFVLRIEDTDEARNTQEAVKVIFDGLRWLGLDWDEGPDKGGECGPYYQSQRKDIYKRRVKELMDKGHAYEKEGVIKFKMPREPITIPDLIVGNVTRPLSESEMFDPDFIIFRSDGSPVFHFVNVVDDLEMKITHVLRGEDHLSNTPKHLALFAAFGVEPPKYAHIPLILNHDGSKMSKRDKGAHLNAYMEEGFAPEAVRNYLCLLGWSPKNNREIVPIEEIVQAFDLPQIKRHNARFDYEKCHWMNGQYITAMSLDRFVELGKPFLQKAGLLNAQVDEKQLREAMAIVKEKVKQFNDLPNWTRYLLSDDFPFDTEAVTKTLKQPNVADLLGKLRAAFAAVANWEHDSLDKALRALAQELNAKAGALVHPCRVAVSGKSVGPSLFHMLAVLGKDRVLKRLDHAIQHLCV
jgi:glutamyl-tRNA synthetase